MPIKVRCRCGKGIKVRESAAGKRVKCPDCGKPIRIPDPEPEYDDYDDEYGGDSYGGDDPYGDDYDEPAPRRKPAKKKSKKKSGGGIPAPVLIIGGILMATFVVAGGIYAVVSMTGNDPNIPSTETAGTAPGASTDGHGTGSSPTGSGVGSGVGSAAGGHGSDVGGHGAGGSVAGSGAGANGSGHGAGSQPMPASTAGNGNSGGRLWVVLSDFKNRGNSSYQVSYRVVSGQPDPSTKYVLYVGSALGMMERYNEIEVIPSMNGTVPVPVGIGMSTNLKAYMAIKKGRQDWDPVSGEISVGGGPTAGRRPPTVAESAGASAQGKMLAIANPRFETGRIGRNALVVDFELQQASVPGKRYYLIISGNSGNPVSSDVSLRLMRAKVGEKDSFGVSLIGPGDFPNGPLTVHVETRQSLRGNGTAVSNAVTLQR